MGGAGGMGGMDSMGGGAMGGADSKKNKKKGGADAKGNKNERPPIKDFQPKGEKKEYHPSVLRAREPIPNFQPAKPSSYEKGGKVRKSGKAQVEKGEVVLTAKEAREYRKKMGKRISTDRQGGGYSRKPGRGKAKNAKKRMRAK
jgi:hypothetical protein